MAEDDKFKRMLSVLCSAVYDQQYILNSKGWVTEEDGKPLGYSQQWSHAGARRHLYDRVDELLCSASAMLESDTPGSGPVWVGCISVTDFEAPMVITDSKSDQFPTVLHFVSEQPKDIALEMCTKTFCRLTLVPYKPANRPTERYVFHNARVAVLPGSSNDRVRMAMIYSTFTVEPVDE